VSDGLLMERARENSKSAPRFFCFFKQQKKKIKKNASVLRRSVRQSCFKLDLGGGGLGFKLTLLACFLLLLLLN
jgi:hypothetical protein